MLLSKGCYDLYYRQALKVWNRVRWEFENALTGCDLILLPVVKELKLPVADNLHFLEAWADDLYCAPVSLAGLPGLCIPAGLSEGMPVGLQLVGSHFSDEMLVSVGDLLIRENRIFPYGN
jgi:aspartyl-tRNA(Asn)/glutamyl-tRNA(Gln) amidotransferase subunit A